MGGSRPEPDSIVLGGGIIGCALAEELARRGQRVVVLERGQVGLEASSAAAGILSGQMDLADPGPFFDFCQAARSLYPAWLHRIERAARMSTEFRVNGILYVAATASEARVMAARARWQRRRGFPVERWSPADIRRREPVVDGRFLAGFFFPREAQLDNAVLMRALAVACRRAGVAVRERVSAKRILLRHNAVAGVETDRGTIRAPVVVNCLGSWAAMGGGFPVPLPVEPARGQLLVFHGPRRLLRASVMSGRAYMVQRRNGHVLVGSTVERAGFEKALTLEGMHRILDGVRRMSQAVARGTFVEAWAGLRPRTPDDLPILGPTRIHGLYVATGHFRHGILLAPATAQALADLILQGRASSMDLAPFSVQRFA